jgi:hypothetical protein
VAEMERFKAILQRSERNPDRHPARPSATISFPHESRCRITNRRSWSSMSSPTTCRTA